jgi:RNA-binding protein Musashi
VAFDVVLGQKQTNTCVTIESLKDYFSQFGEVLECTVMRDAATGRSRGFGFLTFKDPKTVNIVMVKEHHLDGKIVC